MKKTVIKRRKRVPAAGGVSAGRMTDQAAAEALVAVGRRGVGGGAGEESDGEGEQPRRKKTRKGKSEREKRAGRGAERADEDVVMGAGGEGSDDEGEGVRERPQRRRSRESNGSTTTTTTWDLAGMQQSTAENGHAHRGSSPPLDHRRQQQQQRAPSISRGDYAAHLHPQRASSHTHSQFLGGSPHGGFDLPPLTAALGGGGGAGAGGAAGSGGYGGYGTGMLGAREYVSGAPSSYIRSSSSAPSRTHSPLGLGAAAGGSGGGSGSGYVLPPPHSLSHGHHGLYYGPPTGMSPLHSHSPPPQQQPQDSTTNGLSSSTVPSSGIPTVPELERHYEELHEQRRRLEEMVEKNERMMAGVKRGLDEMRAGHAAQGGPGAASRSLVRDVERPRSRASVWPLDTASRD